MRCEVKSGRWRRATGASRRVGGRTAVTLSGLLLAVCAMGPAASGAERPNVLFIAVDDLRPELNCYGVTRIQSPNIDRLAQHGTLFERAYCMVPTCGASRAALMTGIRPSRNRFITHLTYAQEDAPGITTMNTWFRQHGYRTGSLGKIFHHPTDSAEGWSTPAWRPQGAPGYQLAKNRKLAADRRTGSGPNAVAKGPPFEAADRPDDQYPDGMVAAKAIETLQEMSQQEEPFFLAVGFFKPHLPFVCPQKYWDLYPKESIELPSTYHRPQNAPDVAIHNSGELRGYAGIKQKGLVGDEMAKDLIRGYSACVSFTDAQIGKVLDEVDRLGLAENTIVVLWGDHGWNLGEHTLWCKHSCFETSMRIPVILRGPGVPKGQRIAAIVETIDLYPTLCKLTGLNAPTHLEGVELTTLMANPTSPGKGHAIGRFNSGDTLRKDDARYTEYTTPEGERLAEMLYDHRQNSLEDDNIAGTEEGAVKARKLREELHERKGRDGVLGRQGQAEK